MPRRFYVTTPIYYINDVPHLGSAYTTIAADVLARYKGLRGFEARMLTGTDEHGLKIQRAAEERGISPQALADEVSAVFREAWPKLGCAPDDFIRTSEPRHKKWAQDLWRHIAERGDIYLGHYEGLYCVGCEAYYTEKDLKQPGNVCPLHLKPIEVVKEESYFFRLSKYGERLLDFYRKTPGFVQPQSRQNEVTSFVSAGLSDLSISRTTFRWGIEVPGDPKHVMWVWIDALSNYLNAVKEPGLEGFWPASVHLVGKDILRFHAVYWPAFLMAAGYPDEELPRAVFAHGFLTYGGQKMSKALRNTVSPVALAEAISPTIGADVLRYGLMRAISFGQDGDFSVEDLLTRYASELANGLGNLLNRIHPFADAVPERGEEGPLERTLFERFEEGASAAAQAFDANAPTRALDAIWTVVAAANRYVDEAAPWVAKKKDPARLAVIVGALVEVLSGLSAMVAPVMPRVSAAMRAQLGLPELSPRADEDQWPMRPPARLAGEPLQKGSPIFPRLDKDHEKSLLERFRAPKADATSGAKEAGAKESGAKESGAKEAGAAPAADATELHFDDWKKVALRVGLVLTAERIPKKDKLLKLSVDVGEPEPRRIVAGIAPSYAPEELVGKRVVVLCNLPPRSFGKDLVSHGMLLAADAGPASAGSRLLTVDGEAAPGAEVR